MNRQRRAHRVGRAVAALAVLAAISVAGAGSSAATSSDPFITDSAVTQSGSGDFADLSVTVGKTRSLGNEAVKVSWRWRGTDPGSHATASDTAWNYNYLSIFQCWGDAADGPTRDQCQYGGQFAETDGINTRLQPFSADANKRFAVSRAVSPSDVFGHRIPQTVDPLEDSDPAGYPATGPTKGVVPLRSAPSADHPDGERLVDVDTGQLFDKYGTNEVPLARTNGDGSGSLFFEAQTVFESQFLGCGARVDPDKDGIETGRPCWLVVVPRGPVDADGVDVRTRPGGSTRALYSSPLSLSNWNHRIAFPLQFEPVREPCSIGGVERPVVGHESLAIAMSSWQGPLCRAGQGFFYATTTDDIARSTVASDLPKLSVFTDSLAKDAVPETKGAAVYAPVAVSGVTIGLFLEREYNSASDPKFRPFTGSRVEQLKLTPRLVAKLLTESYRYSTWVNEGGPAHLAKAPLSLIDDPEFVAVNGSDDPALDVVALRNQRESLAKLYVTPDASDAVRLLWEWVLADADARAFLDGAPDPWGMVVNQYYAGGSRYRDGAAARDDIPRLEEACTTVNVGATSGPGAQTKQLCALDAAPYVASFDQGAALAARGQQIGVGSFTYDAACDCAKSPRPDPQLVGQRALLTLTDTPSAARRGLVTASLRNGDGTFVAPTADSMAAALGQSVATDTTGVRRVDPAAVKGSGYPLTRLSYAVTNPVPLDAQTRKDYANFVEVVATDGQVPGTRPGTLPPGYAPLPGSYQVAAVTAAAAIRNPAALPTTPPEPSAAADTPVDGSTTALDGGSVPAPDLAAVDGSVLAVGAPAAVVPGSVAPATTVTEPATTLVARVAQLAGPWALPALAVAALVVGVAGRLVSLLGSRETDAGAR
jgi:hypothetical protein